MVRGRLRTLLVALLAAGSVAAGAAAAAPAASLVDPLEGQPFVADLGELVATVRPDAVLEVRTQIVARPPAGWGGCVTLANGVCMLAEMDVTWRLDHRVGGAPGDGADARVVATPSWNETGWRLETWHATLQRWLAATPPPATTDAGGARWSLPLAWLGGSGERLLLRASSRFVPVDAIGKPQAPLFDETDWLEVALPPVAAPAPSSPAPAPAPSPPVARGEDAAPLRAPAQRTACVKARARVAALDRRIRRAAKVARSGPAARRRAARRELRRLRSHRDAALSSKRRTCAKASQPPSR